jgi:hypothetical protein
MFKSSKAAKQNCRLWNREKERERERERKREKERERERKRETERERKKKEKKEKERKIVFFPSTKLLKLNSSDNFKVWTLFQKW